jgi:hypothetical protein
MLDFHPLDWQVNENYPKDFVLNALGPVPNLLNANDVRQVHEQLNEILAAGWNPEGDKLGWQFNADESLSYPGMPPVMPVAFAQHGLEKVYMYPAQWMVILQLDGSYQVGRIE